MPAVHLLGSQLDCHNAGVPVVSLVAVVDMQADTVHNQAASHAVHNNPDTSVVADTPSAAVRNPSAAADTFAAVQALLQAVPLEASVQAQAALLVQAAPNE